LRNVKSKSHATSLHCIQKTVISVLNTAMQYTVGLYGLAIGKSSGIMHTKEKMQLTSQLVALWVSKKGRIRLIGMIHF
jgi:hypothetical protein